MVVWKFPIPVQDEFALKMPKGAKVLAVGVQNNQPVLWAMCDENALSEYRPFYLRGTGHNADGVGEYVGTFQLNLGTPFVGHVFEG